MEVEVCHHDLPRKTHASRDVSKNKTRIHFTGIPKLNSAVHVAVDRIVQIYVCGRGEEEASTKKTCSSCPIDCHIISTNVTSGLLSYTFEWNCIPSVVETASTTVTIKFWPTDEIRVEILDFDFTANLSTVKLASFSVV